MPSCARSWLVDNNNYMATYPVVVGCGKNWAIAIMVHVGIKAGERGR